MDFINENIADVRLKIEKACKISNRNISDIILCGVSKTRPTDIINKSIECGINHIGENKVQEVRDKYDYIDKNAEWHFIGHLQTNKVKYIIDKIDLIHSVDSLKLATEISKRAVSNNLTMDVLIQVNVAKEEQKYGISIEKLEELIFDIVKLPNISVKGLMNIAPNYENVELVRSDFKKMKELFDSLVEKNIDGVFMEYLSMGMSNDFEIAIEEGANIVRVGTMIYGKRSYV